MESPATLTLRIADIVDLPAIVRIYNQSIPERNATTDVQLVTVEDRIPWFQAHTSRYPLWVAAAEDRVLAWACISPFSEKVGYRKSVENSVYVDQAARGQGIGRALLALTVRETARLRFHTIVARVFAHNPASIALHEHHGFIEMGRLKEIAFMDGHYYDVVYLVRLLEDAPSSGQPSRR